MKKFVALFSIVLIGFLLFGCTQVPPTGTQQTAASEQAPNAAQSLVSQTQFDAVINAITAKLGAPDSQPKLSADMVKVFSDAATASKFTSGKSIIYHANAGTTTLGEEINLYLFVDSDSASKMAEGSYQKIYKAVFAQIGCTETASSESGASIRKGVCDSQTRQIVLGSYKNICFTIDSNYASSSTAESDAQISEIISAIAGAAS